MTESYYPKFANSGPAPEVTPPTPPLKPLVHPVNVVVELCGCGSCEYARRWDPRCFR